jgi:hypothetical protein
MVSLLNDARLGAGKPAMGFLNPCPAPPAGRCSGFSVPHSNPIVCGAFAWALWCMRDSPKRRFPARAVLYANPAAFTDITVGSNKIGRGGQPLECPRPPRAVTQP